MGVLDTAVPSVLLPGHKLSRNGMRSLTTTDDFGRRTGGGLQASSFRLEHQVHGGIIWWGHQGEPSTAQGIGGRGAGGC